MIIFTKSTMALIGYDCAKKEMPNITTVSLRNVGDCEFLNVKTEVKEQYINLLHRVEYDTENVYSCKVIIKRDVKFCGWNSHIGLSDKNSEYPEPISRDACLDMHKYFKYQIYNELLTDLEINRTNFRNVKIRGSIEKNHACQGENFEGEKDVVVDLNVQITLSSYLATINTKDEILYTSSNTVCPYKEESCIQQDNTYVFWSVNKLPSHCNFDHFVVAFKGIVLKTSSNESRSLNLYTNSNNTVFALTEKGTHFICGNRLIITEVENVFIFETTVGNVFPTKRTGFNPKDIQWTTYTNVKLLYLKNHMKNEMEALYNDIRKNRCILEQEVIKNSLSQSSLNSDELAYTIMQVPGYMAVVAGEVAHFIQCDAVSVRVRPTNNTCYAELPVDYKNASYFLTPKSRILTMTGTPRECNRLLPSLFKIDGQWFRLTPGSLDTVEAPQILQPLNKPTWSYTDMGDIANSGIYTNDELQSYHKALLFSSTNAAVLQQVAQGIVGERVAFDERMNVLNLMSEDSLSRFTENTVKKLWSKFVTFGSVSAGVMMIFTIIGLIKYILNTLIHGYALYKIYGFGLRLLAALWGTIANLLLHAANGPVLHHQDVEKNITENERKSPAASAPLEIEKLRSSRVLTRDQRIYPNIKDSATTPETTTPVQQEHPKYNPDMFTQVAKMKEYNDSLANKWTHQKHIP